MSRASLGERLRRLEEKLDEIRGGDEDRGPCDKTSPAEDCGDMPQMCGKVLSTLSISPADLREERLVTLVDRLVGRGVSPDTAAQCATDFACGN